MKLAFHSFLIAPAALALTSCSPPEIKVAVKEVNGRFLVRLTQDWGVIWSDKKAPCVDRIDLRPNEADPDHHSSVWRVEAATDQCVKLDGFVVGEIPRGFRQVVNEPSISHSFTLSVSGIGAGSAQIILS